MLTFERIIIDLTEKKAVYVESKNGKGNYPVKQIEIKGLSEEEQTILNAAINIIKLKSQQ